MFFFFLQSPKYDFKGKYRAIDIAQYIICKCSIEDKPISNLQLQKILYYIQIYFLQKEQYALFSDEFEAWTFGPVIRSVYNKYCGFGSMKITDDQESSVILDEETKTKIDQIVEEKRCLNPWQLVDDTHSKGKAWDLVFCDGNGYKNVISKDMIVANG